MSGEIAYGRWPSPISAEAVAAAGVTYDEARFAGSTLFWLEGRPRGLGRLPVCWTPERGVEDAVPDGVKVESEIYGYGGAAWAADGRGTVWFCDRGGTRLWRHVAGQPAPTPLLDTSAADVKYGDLATPAGGRQLICVREHTGKDGTAGADIIAISADGAGDPVVLAGPAQFTASPQLSADGRTLAWLSWRDPQLPWDGTWLWTSTIHSGRAAGKPVLAAGGPRESVLQPQWGPDGNLYFLSDRSGWWNLYRSHAGRIEPVATADAEMATAPWELGYRSYAFLPNGRIAALLQNGPRHHLAIHQPSQGRLDPVDLPYTSIKPYLAAHGDRLAFIGSSPTQAPTIALLDTATGDVRELAGATSPGPATYLSTPDQITIPTRDRSTIHGLLYPPVNPDITHRPAQPPPLIIRVHPGPTANTTLRLDPSVQYFTSRGYSLLDLDYRGSTGYGRSYRTALNRRWGLLDVADCVDAADHLAATGRADPQATFISGASAGGYTALRALATTSRFAAGTARSAIIDPVTWRTTVPRFQRHHTTTLIGPWPQDAEDYRRRSVLHDAHHITTPVLLIHGDRDHIAPVEPVIELAARLRAAGTPCTLQVHAGEEHTIHSETAVAAALAAELRLYHESRRQQQP